MNLMDYLTEEYALSKDVNAIQAGLQPEVDMAWEIRNDLLLQLDPRTATWGLDLWESAYGLPTDQGKDIEFRRSRVVSKIRGSGSVKEELIKSVAESFSNGAVEVTPVCQEYRLEIRFVGTTGIPPNMDDLQDALDEILPTHLGWEFVFYYRTHEQLSAYTHAQLAAFTHNTIREGDLTNGN